MIGKLKGIIDEKTEDHLTLDVNGVGYEIFCATRTLADLPSPGEPALLWIETIVREDFIKLYGFARSIERGWFRLLTTVQGVGAKVALSILSTLKSEDLARAIALQDKSALAHAPGVGPKLAARIVQELKDKAPAGDPFASSGVVEILHTKQGDAARDAILALVKLGYAQTQASEIALRLMHEGAANDAASLIRRALKELAAR